MKTSPSQQTKSFYSLINTSKFKIKTLSFLLVHCLLFSGSLFSQNRLYVNPSATGLDNGTSWANGFTDLQTAINSALTSDTLWVKKGVYHPTEFLGNSTDPRSKSFLLEKDIHVYGGFDGTEARLNQRLFTNVTSLNGDLGTANDSSDNAYHVVVGLNYSGTFGWLEIINGNASGTGTDVVSGFTIDQNKGGGIYLDSCAARLENVQVRNNIAVFGGGGVYNYKGGSTFFNAQLEFNRIYGTDVNTGGGAGMLNIMSNPNLERFVNFGSNHCHGVQGGGGMRNEDSSPIIFESQFSYNICYDGDGGGAMYNLNSPIDISNTDFTTNSTNKEAGAMYNDGSPGVVFNTQFAGSTSGANGGGAIENDGGSDIIFTDCVFLYNQTLGGGGAMQNWKSSIELHNTHFVENTAGGDGGAIYNYNQCSPLITNCSFYDNDAVGNGGAFYNERDSHPVITSSLFSKNTAGQKGGGIYTVAGATACSPILTNVTIAYNTAGVSGGGAFDDGQGASKLRNSIAFGNMAPNLPEIDAPISTLATAVFNDIIGNEYYATGLSTPIVFTSAVFSDTSNIYYPIDSAGPAFNTGDNSFFTASATPNLSSDTNDIRGAARIMGANVDLGSYEFCTTNKTPTISISNTPSLPALENTVVTFKANITHGGKRPVYNWFVNDTAWTSTWDSTITGVAGKDFNDGDTISVRLLSSVPCKMGDPADTIYATVNYIGISELAKRQNKLQLFPNPNNGAFKIKTNVVSGEEYQLIITDLRGNKLHEETVKSNQNKLEHEINLGKTLSSGIYVLSLNGKSESKDPKRFVVY